MKSNLLHMKIVVISFFICSLVACSEESLTESSEIPAVHQLEPTDEMMQLAKDQCLDSDKKQGVIDLKDQNSGEIVSRAVVDC